MIKYKQGYKYQLCEGYICKINIFPEKDINSEYINLSTSGMLVIEKGYAWDGPSGPTIDTRNFMRGSLVHDALYQLIRERALPDSCKDLADKELYRICIEDGMSKIRAGYVYFCVKNFADSACDPRNKKVILHAP